LTLLWVLCGTPQSNQRGIETTVAGVGQCCGWGASIEPAWDWNRTTSS